MKIKSFSEKKVGTDSVPIPEQSPSEETQDYSVKEREREDVRNIIEVNEALEYDKTEVDIDDEEV